MREKTLTAIMGMLLLLAVLPASSIATAEEYNRVNFQVFAKGSGRLSFYSSSTGLYWEDFDESMLTIVGTSEIEDMGGWYCLTEGTVKIKQRSIWVQWTYNDKEYELHVIPKVGRKTSGCMAWAFVIDHMSCQYICKVNGKVRGVSEGIVVMTLLTGWVNQITITLDITVEGEPSVIVLYWYDYSADVFRINTQLI